MKRPETISGKTAGFTLIEMMCVLIIISLMTGVVILSLPRQKQVVELQSTFIAEQFDVASQNAIISGKAQAFGPWEEGYAFYEFVNNEWTVLSDNEWPEDLGVKFYQDDIEVDLPDEDPVPVVVFEPMGLSTPFSLWLEGDEQTIVFTGKGDGKVSMETEL